MIVHLTISLNYLQKLANLSLKHPWDHHGSMALTSTLICIALCTDLEMIRPHLKGGCRKLVLSDLGRSGPWLGHTDRFFDFYPPWHDFPLSLCYLDSFFLFDFSLHRYFSPDLFSLCALSSHFQIELPASSVAIFSSILYGAQLGWNKI